MKARGSDDPKVDKNQDDKDKDSQGQDENQVEKKDSPTVAALKEGQEKGVDDSQGEIGGVNDPQGKVGDEFHSEVFEQQQQRKNQAVADGTRAIWQRADDLLLISRVEIQAAEPPRTHDVKLYTNDNLMRVISEEIYDKGVRGICEDWKVWQQGEPLLFKLRWAISEGRKIHEHAIKDYQDLMERAEELVASVGEQRRSAVIKRVTKGWHDREISKDWRPVLDIWYEQAGKLQALAAAAREKRNKKKEKKEKRKRLDEGEGDEETLTQKLGTTETAAADGTITGGSGADTGTSGKTSSAKGFACTAGPRTRGLALTEQPDPQYMSSEQVNRRLERLIDLERLIEAEESEGKKDEIAVESLIKMTGHNEADCTEYLANDVQWVLALTVDQAQVQVLDRESRHTVQSPQQGRRQIGNAKKTSGKSGGTTAKCREPKRWKLTR